MSTSTASLWTVNKAGEVVADLHPGQTRAWESKARFVFMLAGTQGGKTSFGPLWLAREIARCGGGDYLAGTSSYDLYKLKQLPELRNYLEFTLGIGRYWAGERVMELSENLHPGRFLATRQDDPMWGRIILRSAQAVGGLEAATAKAAWLDEVGQDEFGLDAWEAVLRRLALHQGRVLGTTTIYNAGWMKTEIYDRWRVGDPDIEVIQFSSTMNPAFPKAEFERARATMPAWKFAMFHLGEFAHPAGLIYSDFDEEIQWIEPIKLRQSWPRYVGVDPGAVNTATMWIAEDPKKDIFYLYRETLEGGLSTAEHARRALRLAEGENVVIWKGGGPGEDQARMDWQAAGVSLGRPAVSDVEAQIDRVIALFREKRLFIFNTLRGTRDELGTYARVLDERGQPTDKIKDKERFHRLDALRYAVQAFSGPKAGFEWL